MPLSAVRTKIVSASLRIGYLRTVLEKFRLFGDLLLIEYMGCGILWIEKRKQGIS